MASTSIDCIDEYTLQLDDNITKFECLCKDIKTLCNEMRTLKKKSAKLIKLASKSKRRRDDQKEPSGFTCPVQLSDALAEFLGLEHGTTMPRSQVTKRIFEYVKEHNLKDINDGRKFNLNDPQNVYAQALKKLLNVQDDTQVGYFTLQMYLKDHFKSLSRQETGRVVEGGGGEEEVTASSTLVVSGDETLCVEEDEEMLLDEETTPTKTSSSKKRRVVTKKNSSSSA
jgi:upstream activation factor subunit UAF30